MVADPAWLQYIVHSEIVYTLTSWILTCKDKENFTETGTNNGKTLNLKDNDYT